MTEIEKIQKDIIKEDLLDYIESELGLNKNIQPRLRDLRSSIRPNTLTNYYIRYHVLNDFISKLYDKIIEKIPEIKHNFDGIQYDFDDKKLNISCYINDKSYHDNLIYIIYEMLGIEDLPTVISRDDKLQLNYYTDKFYKLRNILEDKIKSIINKYNNFTKDIDSKLVYIAKQEIIDII